ncbi:NAD(P)-dependent oxidoreductase [Candidatus Bathyarchaeota archaeon]|nr:NAD(P)-dependent oxidoreductase [Candidatus Bathyarchaeota archaeon]
MNILVTGGAGRLGYTVAKTLIDAGHTVKAFDLPHVQWSHVEALEGAAPQRGDITDPGSVAESCIGVDAAVHLAAILPPTSEKNKALTQRVNVRGTANLLDALGSRPIVFASSISTYGVTAGEEPPIAETHSQTPHNNYAESKILAEEAVRASGAPYTILRVAPISVVDLLELPDTIAYREDQRVEFVLDEDAAYAVLGCLDEGPRKKVYNIAGGRSWQMTGGEYLARFYAALGVEVEPNYPVEYTAVDWYDTSRGRHLGYQRTSFNTFEERLEALGEELGLR